MLIKDILDKCGWVKAKEKNSFYAPTYFEHPVKNFKYYLQEKYFTKNGKTYLEIHTTKKQGEVSFDEVNKLLIIDNDIAIHVG